MKSILSGGDKAPAKKAAKSAVKKVRVVDLGDKGSFKITKPGALKKKAQTAGESTKEFAKSHDKGKSTTAKQSRAALGLMAMGH
jgi:hypothetical protein